MPSLVTDAMILHVADYLDSSRILRLVTREAGVLSVVARGARNSRKRFGSAVDLFAVGQAQIDSKPGKDLHTLISFDVVRSQPGLAADLARFSAASALAECAMRVVHDEAAPALYEGFTSTFDQLGRSPAELTVSLALGALWRLVREVGFAPSMDSCAECHSPVDAHVSVAFSHVAGGILCDSCARRARGVRRLPPSARRAISDWLVDGSVSLSDVDARAHQRLLREFLSHHLTDGRPLRAFAEWEGATLIERVDIHHGL